MTCVCGWLVALGTGNIASDPHAWWPSLGGAQRILNLPSKHDDEEAVVL